VLDSTVILQDVETLLDDHFGHLQAVWQQHNQQTHTMTPPAQSITAIAPPANPIADFVTNVIMLLMFSALEKRLPG
jgi:hypothetical protein